ncbi:MAG: STAS domain-containing protein [Spirochaetales bacterium]|nr:STAS domain-containing protein [Spirochaetales bacterium]
MLFNNNIIKDFNLAHENIQIKAEEKGDNINEVLIKIEGDIETLDSHTLGQSIIDTIKSSTGIQRLIFDLSKVNYLCSSGVGAIIHILTIPECKGIEIFFININDKLRSVFKVLGFADLIKVQDSNSFKTIFPFKLLCPDCQKENTCPKEGTYRCVHCNRSYIVDNKGRVSES